MKHRIARTLFFLVIFGSALGTTLSLAQGTRGHAAARPAPHKKPPKADAGVPASSGFEVDASVEPMSARPENAPSMRDAGTHPTSGKDKDKDSSEVVESKTLDGGAKVFRFGEIEIEGRLKSPQLVYFLRRVRAEFAAGDLGHRTFMRELSDTRRDPSF
jgi:hypothetical protein